MFRALQVAVHTTAKFRAWQQQGPDLFDAYTREASEFPYTTRASGLC